MSNTTVEKTDIKIDYAFFNKIQNDFYKNPRNFSAYSNYDINLNSYLLVNNIAKGFPHLAFDILGIYGNLIKFNECPDLIRALQYKFIGGFTSNNMKHVYYKQGKSTKKASTTPKTRKKKGDVEIVEFDSLIVAEIMQQLFIDKQDYDAVKHTTTVQYLGNELTRKSLL